MANLEARVRMAAESILDNESLRSGLNDEESARSLLNWGVAWAETLARQTADIEDDEEADEVLYPRMRALRGLLTALKDLTAAESWPPDALEKTLETVREHAQTLYGAEWNPPVDFEQNVRGILQTADSHARLNALLALIGGQAAAPQSCAPLPPAPSRRESPRPEGFFAKLFRKLRGD